MRNSDNQASSNITNIQFELTPVDNKRLANLCGPVNQHLQQIEDFYDVKINCRSNQFEITGEALRQYIAPPSAITDSLLEKLQFLMVGEEDTHEIAPPSLSLPFMMVKPSNTESAPSLLWK